MEALECHNLGGNQFGIESSGFRRLFLATATAFGSRSVRTARPCLRRGRGGCTTPIPVALKDRYTCAGVAVDAVIGTVVGVIPIVIVNTMDAADAVIAATTTIPVGVAADAVVAATATIPTSRQRRSRHCRRIPWTSRHDYVRSAICSMQVQYAGAVCSRRRRIV